MSVGTGPSGSTPNGYPFPTQDDQVDVPRDIEALARAVDPNAQAIIIGEVRSFALAVAPAHWLVCDGSAKEQAAFPELFAALGNRFNTGGETPTQFRVPACSGRAVVGSGQGAGLTARAVADLFGAESVALDVSQMPSHNHGGATTGGTSGTDSPDHAHGLADPGHAHAIYDRTDFQVGTGAWRAAVGWGGSSGATYAAGTGMGVYGANARHAHAIPALGIYAQGGGGGHPNISPSIALLVCIFAGR